MLKICKDGDAVSAAFLTTEEDQILRQAFGKRGGGKPARQAAKKVVSNYWIEGGGALFLCNCRPDQQSPSALSLVRQGFISRSNFTKWSTHAQHCDFFRSPAEQNAILRSYTWKKPSAGGYKLLRANSEEVSSGLSPTRKPSSSARPRPKIARVLMDLWQLSRIQNTRSENGRFSREDQERLMLKSARKLYLDRNISLASLLCTDPKDIQGLYDRIDASRGRWSKNTEPNGVIIFRSSHIGEAGFQALSLTSDPGSTATHIPVRGKIAVYGEPYSFRQDHVPEQVRKRPPYIVIGIVGKAQDSDRHEVLKVYAHPCLSYGDLLLVDSDYERETFKILQRLQAEFRQSLPYSFLIEKPIFDIPVPGQRVSVDESEDDNLVSRDVCLPDFILRCDIVPRGSKAVVIETMGTDDSEYRDAKERVFKLMTAAVGRAPIVQHDFYFPKDHNQAVRDKFLRDSVIFAITNQKELPVIRASTNTGNTSTEVTPPNQARQTATRPTPTASSAPNVRPASTQGTTMVSKPRDTSSVAAPPQQRDKPAKLKVVPIAPRESRFLSFLQALLPWNW